MSAARLTVTSSATKPLNCVMSLKAGSTFLRNLIWVLDHGKPYSAEPRSFPEQLPSREMTREELAAEVSFFVLRDPVERFFSLYFDKAIGPDATRFGWIAETLKANRVFHDAPDLSVAQHRENCHALTLYIKARLRGHAKGPINPHWSPQTTRMRGALRFGLQPLLLEKLEPQLLQIAGGRIPTLAAALDMVKNRNRTKRVVSAEDILTPALYADIAALYPEDIELYDLVKTGWEMFGHPPEIEL
jgi:hypothetical protein